MSINMSWMLKLQLSPPAVRMPGEKLQPDNKKACHCQAKDIIPYS
jgi:hypothetical protein